MIDPKNEPRKDPVKRKDVSLGAGVTYEFYKRFNQKCEEFGRHKTKVIRNLLEMWMHGDIELRDDSEYITKREMNEKLDELKKEILLSVKSEISDENKKTGKQNHGYSKKEGTGEESRGKKSSSEKISS